MNAMNIIHGINYAALAIAILYPVYVAPEQAFTLYYTGKPWERTRNCSAEKADAMRGMREDGMTWKQIAKAMGMKTANSAHSYYVHYRR